MVTLSPMTVAPVCHVGDPVQLACMSPVQSLRWSILQVNDQGRTPVEVINSVLIDASDDNQRKQREVNSTTFTFTRNSTQRASPLISILSIDSVSIGLNGTVVRCADIANSTTSASTMIYILLISDANSTVILSKL